jgi:hypothetical protein
MQRTSYSPCCALPHKFYRILTLRLEGAFGRLCDFVSVCPLRIALIMTPSPNLHLLHFPMPDIPHISNMTFNAQMYWQNFDDDTPLSSISLHVCSCIEIFYVIASVLQFDIIASFYYFLLWCGWFYMKQLLSHFFALFPSIPPRCGRIPSWQFFSHSWMHSYTSIVTGNLHLATKSIATYTPQFLTRVVVA